MLGQFASSLAALGTIWGEVLWVGDNSKALEPNVRGWLVAQIPQIHKRNNYLIYLIVAQPHHHHHHHHQQQQDAICKLRHWHTWQWEVYKVYLLIDRSWWFSIQYECKCPCQFDFGSAVSLLEQSLHKFVWADHQDKQATKGKTCVMTNEGKKMNQKAICELKSFRKRTSEMHPSFCTWKSSISGSCTWQAWFTHPHWSQDNKTPIGRNMPASTSPCRGTWAPTSPSACHSPRTSADAALTTPIVTGIKKQKLPNQPEII